MEISEDLKQAYREVHSLRNVAPRREVRLIDGLRDYVAEAMELKFGLSHRVMPSKIISMQQESFGEQEGCEVCGPREKFDPRHDWTPEDYKRAAHAALMGEEEG